MNTQVKMVHDTTKQILDLAAGSLTFLELGELKEARLMIESVIHNLASIRDILVELEE